MHRIKINNKNFTVTYVLLPYTNVSFGSDALSAVSNNHRLKDGEKVYLERNDGDVSYYDSTTIVKDDKNTFHFDYFNDRMLYVRDIEYRELATKVTKNGDTFDITYTNGVMMRLSQPHVHISDRTNERSKFFDACSPREENDSFLIKICPNDYANIAEGNIFYQVDHYDGNDIYFKGDYKNTVVHNKFYVVVDNAMQAYCMNLATPKKFHIGERYYLPDCLILTTSNCYDDAYSLFWIDNGESALNTAIMHYLAENSLLYTFWEIDERFYGIDTKALKPNVKFRRRDGDIRIQISADELFATGLAQQDNYGESYVNRIIEQNINPIVDFEKQMFTPSYKIEGDNDWHELGKIEYHLHFLGRKTVRYSDGSEGYDEKWSKEKGNTLNDATVGKSDLLGYLGFDDDDVYYRKNRLKKSFIRISFYDTPDRRTQVLQFYTTIFLDANALYKKYVLMRNNNVIKDVNGFVFTENTNNRLDCTFSCTNNYDRTASSEGFYLYLFPNLVRGTLPTTLYMRVEFNHAKYGSTILMTRPTNNGVVCSPRSNYISSDGSAIDMELLMNDIYTKVSIEYDVKQGRYIWYLGDGKLNSDTLSLDFYEPILDA